MGFGGWRNATREDPCPICGKPDWCSVSEGGSTVICRRKDNGSGTYKVDKAGVGYWYYRLDDRPAPSLGRLHDTHSAGENGREVEPADATRRDLVYTRLLAKLTLSEKHKDNLCSRGLKDEEIARGGYRSLPPNGREEVARTLIEDLGVEVVGRVPGFREKKDGSWALAGAAGLVIPVRDLEKRIVALKVRADREGNGPRYSYISSRGYGGPGPGAPVHVPLADGIDRSAVRITEGELKADIATALSGMLTISVPGVSSWREALPVLRKLRARKIHLAFDADASTKKVVARAASEAFRALEKEGFEVVLESWSPEHGKGIDDLLCADHSPTLLAGNEARTAITRMVAKASGLSVVRHKPVSAKDLLNRTFPEPKWAVENILPEGVTILGGKPKMGKSWLALNVAVGVASGDRVLGGVPVEQGDVLSLALEDNERRLQSRLKKLLDGKAAPERLEFANRWPRLDDGGLEEIEAWLIEHPDARLVVIDTLAKIRARNGGKNVYTEDYQAVEQLVELAGRHNVAIVVVHHLRKMAASDPLDQISGSLGLTGGVDGALVLNRERGRADARLYVTGRDIEDDKEYALSWDNSTASWQIVGEAEAVYISRERQEIIECLRSLGCPAEPKQVAEVLGKKHNNVKQLLWKMAGEGQIRNIGGKYTPVTGNPGNSDNPEKDNAESAAEDPGKGVSKEEAVTGVTEVTGYRCTSSVGETPPILASTPEQVEEIARQIGDAKLVAVDLETTGLNPRTDEVRLISISTTEATRLIDCSRVDPSPLFPILAGKKLVFHNALFDLGFLQALGFEPGEGGAIVDTMLISQLLGNEEAA